MIYLMSGHTNLLISLVYDNIVVNNFQQRLILMEINCVQLLTYLLK